MRFKDMTSTEKSLYLNEKFIEMDGQLYHRNLDHPSKNYGPVGYVNGRGYRRVHVDGSVHSASRIIYSMHHGCWPEQNIGHIDNDRSNNNIDNLCETSPSCSMRTRSDNINNRSGIRGVCWYRYDSKWKVGIGKRTVGYFKDFAEAVCARHIAEQCLEWGKCGGESPAGRYIKNGFKF